jgi:predicted HAD superfamily Cof-like phosphohydrolase
MNDLTVEDIYKVQWRLDNPDPPTNADKVAEFHRCMGMTNGSWPPTRKEVELRMDLINEEFIEVLDEVYNPKTQDFSGDEENYYPEEMIKTKVAKELADLLYVVYGTALSFGIPIDEVFDEVHRSNMSKLVDGKPLKREDGKVLKGPNYTPPNFDWIIA